MSKGNVIWLLSMILLMLFLNLICDIIGQPPEIGDTISYGGMLVESKIVEKRYENSPHELRKNFFQELRVYNETGRRRNAVLDTIYFEINDFAPDKKGYYKGVMKVLENPLTEDGRRIFVMRGIKLEKIE